MACFRPMDGWRAKKCNENGKRPIVFNKQDASLDEPIKIPCGGCIGCRLEHSRQWAMRCVHESQQHAFNSFITLTYDDDHLPHGESLFKPDWQLFMKRLRRRLEPQKIRFFMCGEYGINRDVNTLSTLGRPHYHAIIFGTDFPDRLPLHSSDRGNPLYISPLLDEVWGKGLHSVADFSFDTAAYVARYCMKKINGDLADDHYLRTDCTTGECTYLVPEFTLSSRNPGIGKTWFDKYSTDLHKGYITMNGKKVKPPKYYDRLLEQFDEYEHEFLKRLRFESIDPDDPEYMLDRLATKEKLETYKAEKALIRTL